MDSYNGIDQLEIPGNHSNIVNHEAWFPAGTNYNDVKPPNSNIYDNNDNTTQNEEENSSLRTIESSVAANSLQTFVEEALRSVEDDVASLDHRALNMMVARQKVIPEISESSSTLSNDPFVTSNSSMLPCTLTPPSISNPIVSRNASSSGLDLAQVVSEIFNDTADAVDTSCTNEGDTQYCKIQSSYVMYHDSGNGNNNQLEPITHASKSDMSSGGKSCLQNTTLPPSAASSLPITGIGPLVVSPSILSKVLSESVYSVPFNTNALVYKEPECSSSPITLGNVQDPLALNPKCDSVSEYTLSRSSCLLYTSDAADE